MKIDVRALDVDFMAFSSHKMFGPNGVGVLYVRRDRYRDLGLGNLGGGMVSRHAEESFEPREAPFRYEAGTPNIEGVIGLGAAVDYVLGIGLDKIAAHSRALGDQLLRGLAELEGATVLGRSAKERIALATVSLPLRAMRQQDVARFLADAHGTARTCCTSACTSTARCARRRRSTTTRATSRRCFARCASSEPRARSPLRRKL
jgi:cysteine desulfurase/selenocysteine lyase